MPQRLPKRKAKHEIEHDKICKENIAILKHLQSQKSNYDVYKWECDRRNQEQLMKQIRYHKSNKLKDASPSRFNKRSMMSSGGDHQLSNRDMLEKFRTSKD